MEKRLILEDQSGKVIRSFGWQGESAQVIRRGDTRRLEVVTNTEALEQQQIPFENLGVVSAESLTGKPYLVGKLGHLKLVESIVTTEKDLTTAPDTDKNWYKILLAVFILAALMLGGILSSPLKPSEKMEEAMKQEVVKIFKTLPPKQKLEIAQNMNSEKTVADQPKTKSTTSLKRMGALAALGSLSKSKQKGGLDLGAANTSAGPGLGGTEGSGGTQTSLYAKGITSAPLGAGGNIQGAGGYGTKGKGGGQAGYGKLSLVGAAGDNPIPLGNEATVETGLDRDMIAAVINRNLGQVRFCYEQGLQGSPGLNGRIAVGFTIGGNGMVKAAGIDSSTMASKIVEDCIVMRLKTWKFPLPQGGVDVKVSYPFVLRRAGQGQ